jgi:tetratricopeptide (TPR) repeat protein
MLQTLTLVGIFLAAAPDDSPEVKKKARDLFQAGLTLVNQGRFAEALERFEQTWAVRPHPSIQYNIGRCEEQLDHPFNALRAFREYLRLSPNAADREQVFESIARLERKLRAKGLQELSVEVDRPGATVRLDGVELGAAPVSLALPVGPHRVQVTLEGYEPIEQELALTTTRPAQLSLRLTPVREAPQPSVVADSPRVQKPVVLEPPAPEPTSVALTPPAPPPNHVPSIIAGSVAVAAAGVAGGLLAGSYSNAGTLAKADPSRTGPQTEALLAGGRAMGTGSEVAWGVAGAAAVTFIILLVVGK